MADIFNYSDCEDKMPLLNQEDCGNGDDTFQSDSETCYNDSERYKTNIEVKGCVNSIEKQTKSMRKEISLFHGVAFIVGTMIGSGIFVSPRFVMQNSGSVGLTLIIWGICGVVSLLGALCYIELGTLIQQSGGEYTYIKTAFGKLPAFLVVWTYTLILKPLSLAVLSLSFAHYVFLPVCEHFDPKCNPEIIVKLIAVICIGVITFINCWSIRWAIRMQVFFTGAKLLAIIWLIGLGIYNVSKGQTSSFENIFNNTSQNLGEIGHGFYSGLWAYDGWNQLNYMVEELQNPRKNLPRAILIALPLVTVCYIFVNMAYLTVLSPVQLASSDAVAFTVVEKTMGSIAWLLPILVACSCYGAANGSVFTSGRLVYVAGRDGLSPKLLAMFQRKTFTPLPAILFTSSLGVMAVFVKNIGDLLNYCSFTVWIIYGVTMTSLVVLRWKLPKQQRPYKVFIGFPILMVLVAAYLVFIPLVAFPLESFIMLFFILLAIPVYFVFIVGHSYLPSCVKRMEGKMTSFLQNLCDVVEPPLSG